MKTERTTLRRRPGKGSHDRAVIDAILDEAYYCHLGLVDGRGRPFVIPTIHARDGDSVLVHGSPASRALRAAAGPVDVCLTVTILDGLVLARSAFNHSMNHRSVVLYGEATPVEDLDEKVAALERIVEHVVPGRVAGCRPPTEKELRGTLVLRVPLDEASAKVRAGGPVDDDEDMDLDVWAGHIPLNLVAGEPVTAPDLTAGAPPYPGYALARGANAP